MDQMNGRMDQMNGRPLVPGSDCPFLTDPPLMTLDSFTDVCRLVFGEMDVVRVVAPAAGRANERTAG